MTVMSKHSNATSISRQEFDKMHRQLANIEKGKRDIVDDMIVEVRNLFLETIISEPFLKRFEMLTLTNYNGITDPIGHIKVFSLWMRLCGIHKYIMC